MLPDLMLIYILNYDQIDYEHEGRGTIFHHLKSSLHQIGEEQMAG
jgi:hypothetical protein